MYVKCVVALLCLVSAGQAAIDSDLVTNLPGLATQPSFKHYSGYLKGAVNNRQLHYWFVESANDPSSDPLVVWLNGGPGCSSLDGLLSEHGPFLANTGGESLRVNPYSWNRIANMLYLEAPACVGYSFSSDGNCTTTDDQVSLDNYWALKYFLNHFPEFANHDFFITGESYGGIYVPTLSLRVAADSTIKFKGFAIGNGLGSYELNGNSIIYYGYYHGLWGSDLWGKLVQNCCDDGDSNRCDFVDSENPTCNNAVNKANSIISSLNIYNLYDECYHEPGVYKTHSIVDPLDVMFTPSKYINKQKSKVVAASNYQVSEVPPCVDASGMTSYLNRADVRTALHIPSNLGKWEICSNEVGANYIRLYDTMKPQYLKLLEAGKYRMLVYNGDADMACNFLGDQWFVDDLKQKVVTPWKAWHYTADDKSQQVAGFVKQFEQITFLTVKGAGHMVPQNKPVPSLLMFTKFIKGETF